MGKSLFKVNNRDNRAMSVNLVLMSWFMILYRYLSKLFIFFPAQFLQNQARVEDSLNVLKNVLKFEPSNAQVYVFLSDIYRWDFWDMLQASEVKRMPGALMHILKALNHGNPRTKVGWRSIPNWHLLVQSQQ